MTVLDRLASALGARSDIPNQQLAADLAANNDTDGVRVIVEHLWDKDSGIQSDCLKTLYELGMLKPLLITEYYPEFIKLLNHSNNRMVWGAMIALSTIAPYQADALFLEVGKIKSAMLAGSVITTDNGIKTLALIATKKPEYAKELFPFLSDHLKACRPKDVPQHAEHTAVMIGPENQQPFIDLLQARFSELTPAGQTRINKIIKKLETSSK
jgi:hypothetical protein